MPKKKGTKKDDPNDPESLKEAGNKAFTNNNYSEAVEKYTMAIQLT